MGAHLFPAVLLERGWTGKDNVGAVAEGIEGTEAGGDFGGDVVDGREILDLNRMLFKVLG
jgi:hypothetical protein